MICKRCGAFLSQASGSFKLGKELLCRANSSGLGIFQTLPDAFFGVSLRGNVERTWRGFRPALFRLPGAYSLDGCGFDSFEYAFFPKKAIEA
jgi:hypothetical protein